MNRSTDAHVSICSYGSVAWRQSRPGTGTRVGRENCRRRAVHHACRDAVERRRRRASGEISALCQSGGRKTGRRPDGICAGCPPTRCHGCGRSTGGFTDCLLQAGAARVYAIDVGYGQLHWRLRHDPRVMVYERTNIRYLTPQALPEGVTVVTVDVSFISLRLILPLSRLPGRPADVVALVKPQFEVGKGEVGKGGVVRHAQQHCQVLCEVCTTAQAYGFGVRGGIMSPLRGPRESRIFSTSAERHPAPVGRGGCSTLCTQLSLPADIPSP